MRRRTILMLAAGAVLAPAAALACKPPPPKPPQPRPSQGEIDATARKWFEAAPFVGEYVVVSVAAESRRVEPSLIDRLLGRLTRFEPSRPAVLKLTNAIKGDPPKRLERSADPCTGVYSQPRVGDRLVLGTALGTVRTGGLDTRLVTSLRRQRLGRWEGVR